jgi:hemoglobin
MLPQTSGGILAGAFLPRAGGAFVSQPVPRPTLYERLGGVYGIAVVVDDFIDRVMADPRLNANPAVDEAHHKVPPAGFKYLDPEMVCGAAVGPQR